MQFSSPARAKREFHQSLDPSHYRSRIEVWIAELRTSQFEDPELVGPFPDLVFQRPLSSPPQIEQREEPKFREDSFRSRIGNLIGSRNHRTSRSVGSRTLKQRYAQDATSMTSISSSASLLIMSQDSEKQGTKDGIAVPTPIQGDFIPVSPKKHRSPSPQRHKPKKSVQINLNLTENQMEKLTNV